MGQATGTEPCCAKSHWETADLPFLRPGIQAFWVPRGDLLDEQSERWLILLGEEARQQAYQAGCPMSPWLRLLVLDHGKAIPVSWPQDLRGRVLIRTAADAVEFVRLFSSVRTWYRFPEFGYVEVKSSRSLLGRLIGAPGEIPVETFRSLGLRDALSVQHEGGFRVRRSVARVCRGSIVGVAVIDEAVGRDGDYCLRVLWEKDVPPDADVVFLGLPK